MYVLLITSDNTSEHKVVSNCTNLLRAGRHVLSQILKRSEFMFHMKDTHRISACRTVRRPFSSRMFLLHRISFHVGDNRGKNLIILRYFQSPLLIYEKSKLVIRSLSQPTKQLIG